MTDKELVAALAAIVGRRNVYSDAAKSERYPQGLPLRGGRG